MVMSVRLFVHVSATHNEYRQFVCIMSKKHNGISFFNFLFCKFDSNSFENYSFSKTDFILYLITFRNYLILW